MHIVTFIIALIFVVRPADAAPPLLTFQAASEGGLIDPHDMILSADGRLLYVADTGNDRVSVLDAETLRTVGVIGDRVLNAPSDIHLANDGRLYVADTGNDRIMIFEPQGSTARSIGWIETDRGPTSVVRHPTGQLLVSGDRTNSLMVFDDKERVERSFDLVGPVDVDVDEAGTLWVADRLDGRVAQFALSGKGLRSFDGGANKFQRPAYLSIGRDGRVWITDEHTQSVWIIDPVQGSIESVLGSKHQDTTTSSEITAPLGIVVAGDSVWISDTAADRIVRFRIKKK